MSLEQRLGTQWAVWVGGLALALGGIFWCATLSLSHIAEL
jgi:uncharacterized membrane protein